MITFVAKQKMADNDSRFAALRWYAKKRLGWLFNTSTFTGNIVIALIATYFFRELGYGDAVDYVFLISCISVGLWISEAIPPFAVGIFIIASLLFGFGTDFLIDESAPVQLYVGTWTSNVIWLLLGGFFLAEGMRIVQLDLALFRFTLKQFGEEPEKLLLGLMLTTALASMVMSNTATTAMMISSVLPLIRGLGKRSAYSKALLTGIPAAASVGGVGTIIGSTPNAIAIGALQERGIHIGFVDWMVFGFPVALLLVYLFYRFLLKTMDIKSVVLNIKDLHQTNGEIDKTKRRAVLFTLIVTVSLWLTEPLHGIPLAGTSAVPIVLLTLLQVMNAQDVRQIPWDTLMLVAGGLGLGIAIVDVGLSDIIMQKVNTLPLPTLGIVLIFGIVAVLMSNVMSNTAAASILVPLGMALPYPFGIAAPLVVAISCAAALFLPVSTPPNAIAYATEMLEQKDFRPGGVFFALTGPAVAFIAVLTWVWLVF